MSRLIIKNLPNHVTTDHLRELFGQKGEVTDVQLKYTKDGKFRNFGFVGFRSEEQATAAREYFDGTCIRSMKIDVQICANLGDDKKPRAWSKYATDSTAYKKLHKNELDEKAIQKKEKKITKNKNKIVELLKKHKDDPLFAEFIDAHTNEKTAWMKEALSKAQESDGSDDDSGVEDSKAENDKEDVTEPTPEVTQEKTANKKISDLEYMKTLMKKVGGTEEPPVTEATEDKPKKVRNRPLFYVKLTGLPFKCKKKDIKDFFRPLVPYSLRLPHGRGARLVGFSYVGFRTEAELKKALAKDKLFIGKNRIHVHKYDDNKKAAEEEEQTAKWKEQEKVNNEESIGESGSIFVRNLPYVVSEAEVTELFEKYGPLAEVNMPIDANSRRPKGFATVTFVVPEQAAAAHAALAGSVFAGRMLHLLPARAAPDDSGDEEGLSYKEKKARRLKATAKSSHNWNALFLGANAAADAVAAAYDVTKQQLLSDEGNTTSAAVRLALGETQLVAQTKQFLEDNGVYLDAFNRINYWNRAIVNGLQESHHHSQPAQRRSKTCILVKNLPAHTARAELEPLFARGGRLARLLLPPHGICALVDYIEPYEAKKAFSKLAYSQFKNAPLYLEWAPENVFVKDDKEHVYVPSASDGPEPAADPAPSKPPSTQAPTPAPAEQSNDDEEPEDDTTLFVKNVNFKTSDETLREHFAPCGRVYSAHVARKPDPRGGAPLSMGFGFVRFYTRAAAAAALKTRQGSALDGKNIELKRSEKANRNEVTTAKKTTKETKQNGTKILVRNVPFQANSKELHEIFRAFGEIKTLRLPKKLTPGADQHRGFAFVDYHSKTDAKSAFDALCQSTHVYGRRLVLEWAEQADEDVEALRKRTADAYNARAPGGKRSRKGAVDVETFVEG